MRLPDLARAGLTPRERDVCALLLEGWSNAEIGEQLELTERTVKAYVTRLCRRSGIKGGIHRIRLAVMLSGYGMGKPCR